MQKNKTHRIISISPSNQNQNPSLKNSTQSNHPHPHPHPHQASASLKSSSTPMKKMLSQNQTRTNTYAQNTHHTQKSNTHRAEDSCCEDDVRDREREREKGRERDSHRKPRDFGKENRVTSFKIDEILNRIGKGYEGEKSNSSAQLIKKTQINYLREYLRQAKSLISNPTQPPQTSTSISPSPLSPLSPVSPLSHPSLPSPVSHLPSPPCPPCLPAQSHSLLHSQISSYFSSLHKCLYIKQKQLLQQLDEKLFLIKQKSITKQYQLCTLKNYIQKCEEDINRNYQDIIKKVQIQQVQDIVKSYRDKLDFYVRKIGQNVVVRVEQHERGIREIGDFVGIRVVCQTVGDGLSFQSNSPTVPRLSLDKHISCSGEKQQKQRQHQRQSDIMNQTHHISLNKILLGKKKGKIDDQPRIASARGKY